MSHVLRQRGRQYVVNLFESLALSHPDFMAQAKNSRVVREVPANDTDHPPATAAASSSSSSSSAAAATAVDAGDGPRIITCKIFFSGTNTFPADSHKVRLTVHLALFASARRLLLQSLTAPLSPAPLSTALHTHTHSCHQLYNTSATADYNPSKYLDTSHIGKKELAAMRSLAMRVKHSKTAYVVVGYGWMRFILNDEDKVEEMHVNWRLTSLKVRIAWLISMPPFFSPRRHVRALLCRSCSRCRRMYYKTPTEMETSWAGLARYHEHQSPARITCRVFYIIYHFDDKSQRP